MSKEKRQTLQEALLSISDRKISHLKKKQIKENNKKVLIVNITEETHYQLHKLRLDLKRSSVKNIIIEAINDIFKKYHLPPIA